MYRVGKNTFSKAKRRYRKYLEKALIYIVKDTPLFVCPKCNHENNLDFDDINVLNNGGEKKRTCSSCHKEFMIFSTEPLPEIKNYKYVANKPRLTEEQKKEIIKSPLLMDDILNKYKITKVFYYKLLRNR